MLIIVQMVKTFCLFKTRRLIAVHKGLHFMKGLYFVFVHIMIGKLLISRCRWPRCLSCGSAAARLLGLWVRIPPGAWMFVFCECCVLSGRGHCDELITRP